MTYNPMDLTGRRVLVTGASSGIGRATAVLLARLGARVVAAGRDEARLAAVLGQLEGDGHEAAAFDLADLDGIPGWVAGLCRTGGPLNGLVHCAGIQITRPVRMMKAEFLDEVLRANLSTAFMLAAAYRQKGCVGTPASLVFMSSTSALKNAPGNTAYAASKGGIISATRGLAVELLREGIRVNCVVAALVETEMADRFRRTVSEESFQRIVDMHPLGLGKAEDVANAIAFLVADTARWITGSALTVDGGLLA
ncbi:MAG TPA: SDR family NAD(P)-dependent oxidoreductase [Azospirillaceae bacterium]|nr:SDR family NAD(P)-dependent oxidoreductase [Azospirillaceae bacterium]